MHEMSIAQSILDIALEEIAKQGCDRLDLIRVECGALAGVVPDSLQFCFEALVQGGPHAAARLELVQPSEVHVAIEAPAAAHPVRQIALFLAAPFIGLAYAVAMPLVGLAALLWIGGKALLQTQAAKHAPMFLKNVALLAAAPFIGLLYAMALPFVGMGFLVVTAAKALATSRYAPTMTRFLGYAAKLIAAPFIGLAFAVMLPLVGTAMLFWVGGKALMTRAEVA